VVIHDAAVEKAARYADEHPKAAVVGCQVRESSDNVQMTCFRFPSLLNLFLNCSGLAQAFKYNHFFGREAMLWWRRDSEREVDVVSGMFMLVRSEAIRQVGLLDEDYFLYFEETDWCYRFSRDGWKIVFWPGAGITHVDGGGHSTCQSALKMFIRFTKSLLLFFKKHKGPIQCFIARFTLAVSFGVRWGIWTITKFMRNITGKDSGYAEGKSQQSWAAFKFCAFGVEH
jgi:GT2 family glycosyltransferase